MYGWVGACGVGHSVAVEPSLGVSVAEGNRKLWVLSGKPVRFPGERLWMDFGSARLSERKRSFA